MKKVIWAPWRMEFIRDAMDQKIEGCIFCTLPKEGVGAQSLVLYQGKHSFVILNRYPYTNGHLMVVPNRHVSDFTLLKPEEHQEMGELISRSIKALKAEVMAQGFNIGLNLGDVAGAGIKDHLHYHVVPRWKGDNNFMAVLDDVRMMPQHLSETYEKVLQHFV